MTGAGLATLGTAVRTVFASSSATYSRLTDADERLRTAMPVSRRISFVAATGGAGTTSALTSLGSLLAARRSGMVLAADAAGGSAGVQAHCGLAPSGAPSQHADAGRTTHEPADTDETVRSQALRRRAARDAEDARAGLGRSGSGLYLLDLPTSGHRASSVTEWAEQVGPIARFYDLVLTDWGVRSDPAETAEIAALSHVVVVVGRADPQHAARAAGLARALQLHGPSAESPVLAMLLLVDVARLGTTPTGLNRLPGLEVHLLPYDRARGDRLAGSSRSLGASLRASHIQFAAAVVQAAR